MMNCLTMSYLTFSPTTFSSPIRTHTWVNFMLQIEEHRGVRMRAPGKCRHKKFYCIKTYILDFIGPQQRCTYIKHVIN